MAKLSRYAFAKRITGLSQASVFNIFGANGALNYTLVGDKVDTEHPKVREYMEKHGYNDGETVIKASKGSKKKTRRTRESRDKPSCVTPSNPDGKPRRGRPRKNPEPENNIHVNAVDIHEPFSSVESRETYGSSSSSHDEGHNPADYLDLPMREAVMRFGDRAEFKEWTAAVLNLTKLRATEEDMARKRGDFITKQDAMALTGMIDALHKALLTDVVINVTNTVSNLSKAGAVRQVMEKEVRSVLERTIQHTKSQALKIMGA